MIKREFCINGHRMSKDNVIKTRKGYVICRECRNKSNKLYRENMKAELNYLRKKIEEYERI